MIEKDYSSSALSSIKRAKSIAYRENQSTYGVSHLIISLINEPTGLEEIIDGMGKDASYVLEWFEVMKEMYKSTPLQASGDVNPDSEVAKVFEESERSKIKLGTENIDALCIFTAVVREGVVYSGQQIETLGITEQDILKHYNANTPTFLESNAKENISAISSYIEDLQTQEVIQKGNLILGREKEVRLILENFERSESKGVILVGDSGIGKTATINYFVRELSNSTDEYLKSHLVFKLNVPKLLAGASSENDVNKKISELFEKLESIDAPSILVVDDLHVLLENSSGKTNAIVNILNAQLSEGRINMIFTINSDSYRKNLERHPIDGKLEILKLEELGGLEMLKCLHRHKKRLELHFDIKISDRAIEESIHLSKRYFKEKKLPYGAIDL
ncbi:Clp protease ClpA, partial [Rhodobacteraceae bacterium 4F10]